MPSALRHFLCERHVANCQNISRSGLNCTQLIYVYINIFKESSVARERGIQRQDVVPDGRFWLGEKALEGCSEEMLKDLNVRDLKGT